MISIITPTYNHEEYIEDCIRSVIGQSCGDWEMIVIDDGSTDGTAARIAGFRDDRIRYFRQENRGIKNLAATYNRALGLARGDLVAILEGDDYWPHDKLELQARDFEDPEVVLSFGYTEEVPASGEMAQLRPRDLPREALTNTPVGRAAVYMMNLDVLTMPFPVSVVIRKEALLRIGGFIQPPYLPLTDFPTFLTLTKQGRFAFHEKVLGYWRRHGESVTRKNSYLIHEGVYRFISGFIRDHAASLPAGKEEIAAVEAQWKQYRWSVWFLLGRWFLLEGNWDKARQAFGKAGEFNNNWKQRAFLGACLALSRLHRHAEPLAALAGLPHVMAAIDAANKVDLVISKDLLNEPA